MDDSPAVVHFHWFAIVHVYVCIQYLQKQPHRSNFTHVDFYLHVHICGLPCTCSAWPALLLYIVAYMFCNRSHCPVDILTSSFAVKTSPAAAITCSTVTPFLVDSNTAKCDRDCDIYTYRRCHTGPNGIVSCNYCTYTVHVLLHCGLLSTPTTWLYPSSLWLS